MWRDGRWIALRDLESTVRDFYRETDYSRTHLASPLNGSFRVAPPDTEERRAHVNLVTDLVAAGAYELPSAEELADAITEFDPRYFRTNYHSRRRLAELAGEEPPPLDDIRDEYDAGPPTPTTLNGSLLPAEPRRSPYRTRGRKRRL